MSVRLSEEAASLKTGLPRAIGTIRIFAGNCGRGELRQATEALPPSPP
jgi:hypothetical protein